ncbi:MAG: SDR family oxidoreductase [bacterium]|nr:SDR family oxidoreductase [bacterium]
MLLQDRVCIVSGIGPGLGRSVALACAREGADVVLAARSADALAACAAEVRALGRRALPVPTDLARAGDGAALAAAASAEFGRIDVLVNNAFLSNPTALFEEAALEDWRRMFEVNVFGALALTQAVVPHMKAQGRGSIVFVNSMSIRIVEPRMGGYAASKGALMTAAQTLARELGAHGIRVNSVVPGYIWSDKMEGYFRFLATQQGTTYEAVHADIAGRTALRHIPDSDEIADAVVFFASELSRAISGQALDVNGGHHFH